MSKISQVIRGYESSKRMLGRLVRVFGAPEPGDQLLSRRRLYSLKLELERQLGSKTFVVGCFACAYGVGSTTVASEIGRLLAETLNGEVVVLDTNLHAPVVEGSGKGLSDYLMGDANLEEIIQESPLTTCKLICAGTRVLDRAESMLSSPRFPALLSRLREKYGAVILDCAPVNPHPDTILFCSQLDGLILVLESERDRWEAAREAIQIVESSGGRVIGAVINKKRYYIPQWLYQAL